jgi:hypothetical protein
MERAEWVLEQVAKEDDAQSPLATLVCLLIAINSNTHQ